MIPTICPNCGGTVSNGKCEFCDTSFHEGNDAQEGLGQAGANDTYQYHSQGKVYNEIPNGTMGNGPRIGFGPGYNPQAQEKEPFYKNNTFIILMLFFVSPVGIVLMWFFQKFNLKTRIVLTLFFGIQTVSLLKSAGSLIMFALMTKMIPV